VDQPAALPPVAAKAPEPAPLPQPATPAPEVAAAPVPQGSPAAPPTENASIPTLTAEPVGNPEDQRFASGKAIIRRGDNLWTIARRVYGHGRNYTTIYHANDAQIRDPDRIYPGQIFGLPKMSAGQSKP
jgi:nucleoid-associated protein YgaU